MSKALWPAVVRGLLMGRSGVLGGAGKEAAEGLGGHVEDVALIPGVAGGCRGP